MKIKKKINIRKQEIVDYLRKVCIKTSAEFVFIGDSIVSNLKRYPELWKKIPCSKLNLGIPGDKIEFLWQRILDLGIPKNSKLVVIHVGTNNIARDPVPDVAAGISSMVGEVSRKYPLTDFVVSPILPRFDKCGQLNKLIDKVNVIVQTEFSKSEWQNVHLLQYPSFSIDDFYSDRLHLVGSGYAKIVSTLLKHFFWKGKLILPVKPIVTSEVDSDVDFSNSPHSSSFDDTDHYDNPDKSLRGLKKLKKPETYSLSYQIASSSSDSDDPLIPLQYIFPSKRISSSEDSLCDGFVDLGVESPSISCSLSNKYAYGRVKKNLKNITRARAKTPADLLKGQWKIGSYDPYSKHPARLPTFLPYSPKQNRAGERKFMRSIATE